MSERAEELTTITEWAHAQATRIHAIEPYDAEHAAANVALALVYALGQGI